MEFQCCANHFRYKNMNDWKALWHWKCHSLTWCISRDSIEKFWHFHSCFLQINLFFGELIGSYRINSFKNLLVQYTDQYSNNKLTSTVLIKRVLMSNAGCACRNVGHFSPVKKGGPSLEGELLSSWNGTVICVYSRTSVISAKLLQLLHVSRENVSK